MNEKADTWDLAEGDEIAPGRSVLKALGGGHVYEVYLVWDDHLFSLAVAKVLRPGRAQDADDLEDLAEEAEMLPTLAHPVIVRGFGAVLDGPHPHLLIEHLEGPTLRRLIRRHGKLPLEEDGAPLSRWVLDHGRQALADPNAHRGYAVAFAAAA